LARKAVAATLASVLLLTAMVAADATVVAASDNLASSAQMSKLEATESLLRQYSTGSAAVQSLAQVQSFLSSNPANCASLPQYLGSISAKGSSSGEDSGVSYKSNATAAAVSGDQVSRTDNLTVAAPFSGYLRGALNLRATLSTTEVGGGGSVSLDRNETHMLHLPISPASSSSLCASTLASLGASLSSWSCNATLAQAGFDSAMPSLLTSAAARGFFLAAGWAPGTGCSATYWIMLVELGVEGVTGRFDWTVLGFGSTASA
jgi:hypothetical protein